MTERCTRDPLWLVDLIEEIPVVKRTNACDLMTAMPSRSDTWTGTSVHQPGNEGGRHSSPSRPVPLPTVQDAIADRIIRPDGASGQSIVGGRGCKVGQMACIRGIGSNTELVQSLRTSRTSLYLCVRGEQLSNTSSHSIDMRSMYSRQTTALAPIQ